MRKRRPEVPLDHPTTVLQQGLLRKPVTRVTAEPPKGPVLQRDHGPMTIRTGEECWWSQRCHAIYGAPAGSDSILDFELFARHGLDALFLDGLTDERT